MDKYLLQILHEVNTIIIPGLGALTVTDKSTGEIMFMSYLKHDDGNLSKFIAEKDGIPENDAKNMIAKYVRDIQAQLDKGESYDMYQFGSFVKKDGEIDFAWWENTQSNSASELKLEKADLTTEPEQAGKEKNLEEENSIIKEEQATVETETTEEEKTPKKSVIVEANEVIADALKPTETVEIKANDEKIKKENISETETPKEDKKIDHSKINPSENVYIPENEVKEIAEKQATEKKIEPKTTTKVVKVSAEDKKRRSPVFWFLVILGMLVVLGGATTAIFYDKVQTILFGEQKSPIEDPKLIESSEENLEEIEKQVALENEENKQQEAENTENQKIEKTETPVVEKVKENINQTTNSNLPFHIIAGGFEVEANAQRMAKKFQDEGKNASVLGQFDDLFLVSYSAFATKEEANTAMNTAGIKAWIFKYPK